MCNDAVVCIVNTERPRVFDQEGMTLRKKEKGGRIKTGKVAWGVPKVDRISIKDPRGLLHSDTVRYEGDAIRPHC